MKSMRNKKQIAWIMVFAMIISCISNVGISTARAEETNVKTAWEQLQEQNDTALVLIRNIKYSGTVSGLKENGVLTMRTAYESASITTNGAVDVRTSFPEEQPSGGMDNLGYLDNSASTSEEAGKDVVFYVEKLVFNDSIVFALDHRLSFESEYSNGLPNIYGSSEGDIIYQSENKEYVLVHSNESLQVYQVTPKGTSGTEGEESAKPIQTPEIAKSAEPDTTAEAEKSAKPVQTPEIKESAEPVPVLKETGDQGEETNCTVTGIYFANPEKYPEAEVQIKTSDKENTTLGGNTVWDFGWMIFQPKEGCRIEQITGTAGEIEIISAQEIEKKLQQSGVAMPDEAKKVMKDIPDTAEAVYMDHLTYNKYIGSLFQVFAVKEGETERTAMQISIQNSWNYMGTLRLSVGDEFRPLEQESLKTYYDGVLTEKYFDIRVNGTTYNTNDCVSRDEETGGYIMRKPGQNLCMITDKRRGIEFEFSIQIVQPEGGLSVDDFKVNDEASFPTEYSDTGIYYIYPKDENVIALKNITLEIDLPENLSICWDQVKYGNTMLRENAVTEAQVDVGMYGEKIDATVAHSAEGLVQKFVFSSRYALQGGMELYLTNGTQKYVYDITFDRNSYMSMSGNQTFYVVPYQEYSVFDFIHFYGKEEENKKEFLERVNSGRYELSLADGNLIYKNGEFTGNIMFTKPGSGLGVYDKVDKLVLQSGDMDVQLTAGTILKNQDSLDLAKVFMNGYWDSSWSVIISNSEYITYAPMTHTVKAEMPVNEAARRVEISIRDQGDNLRAKFGLTVCQREDFNQELTSTVSNMQKKEKLIVDVQEEDPTLPRDVLEALQGGDDKHLTIKNSQSDQEVEWNFDSSKLTEAPEKDLRLDVKVGNTTDEISSLLEENNTQGLEVDFENNGVLGGTVDVRINLDEEDQEKISAAQGVNLYYYDEDTGEMTLEQEDLEIYQDPNDSSQNYITLPVTHNSKFVLSVSDQLGGKVIQKPSSSPKPTASAKPSETTGAKPSETAGAKPSETVSAKPSETTGAKPSETASAKPSETASAKPGETASAKPSETASAKPRETASAKPSETASAKPSETVSAKPRETAAAAPDQTPQAEMPTGEKSDAGNKEDIVEQSGVAVVKGVKAASIKRKIILKWKKAGQASGYQIQISDKKNFKKAKVLEYQSDVTGAVLKKANGKRLIKKKKYYIRIRAYRILKRSGGSTSRIYGKYTTVSLKCKW